MIAFRPIDLSVPRSRGALAKRCPGPAVNEVAGRGILLALRACRFGTIRESVPRGGTRTPEVYPVASVFVLRVLYSYR
jgi:hypothetical protein